MIADLRDTPLGFRTEYANRTLEGFSGELMEDLERLIHTDHLYEDAQNSRELDGALRSGLMAEDRFLLAASGALPSEVWG